MRQELDTERAMVGLAMQHVARAWRSEADAALAKYGLSDATSWPLLHIRQIGEGQRQGTLARALGIEGPSLVRLLDHLCAAGLVVRQDDPEDRRAKTIHLTDEGRTLLGRLDDVLTEVRRRMLEGVPEAELKVTLGVLGTIARNAGVEIPLNRPERETTAA